MNTPPSSFESSDSHEHDSSNGGNAEQATPELVTSEQATSEQAASGPTLETSTLTITEDEILGVLQRGEMHELERLPYSSNYNLLVVIHANDRELPAVYKPRRGENPLWDFTSGTLCQREVAAYEVNAMLGWSLIPPTVLRDGVHGTGSVQLYIEHDDSEHYFTVQEDALFATVFRQIALFDFITNNADRKSGHCLIDHARRLWAIDHGICFHEQYKLRTVIWEFSGQSIEDNLLVDIEGFYAALQDKSSQLTDLLSPIELVAMQERTSALLATQTYPEPLPDRRNYPWPPV